MNTSEIINLVSSRQYKSVSNIEKVNKNLIFLDYDYRINLQTITKLSNTVDIYLTKTELKKLVVDPLDKLMSKRNKEVSVSTVNYISSRTLPYYKLNTLIPYCFCKKLLRLFGCNLYLNMKYTLEDDRFISVESETSIKILLFKYKPKIIQPASMLMTLDDADDLINLLSYLY